MKLAPFFKYFGSKYRLAPKYPAPGSTIVEPFAGSACYSLHYPDRRVFLFDKDQRVIALWRFLIGASKRDIMQIPLMEPGQRVDDVQTSEEGKLLLSCCVNTRPFVQVATSNVEWYEASKVKAILWGEAFRLRTANQIDKIRHWKANCVDYADIPNGIATWFVDPPYEVEGKEYKHGSSSIDYEHLGSWCQSRKGQVIVCENVGATWLPFNSFATTRGSKTINGKKKQSAEVIWTKGVTR